MLLLVQFSNEYISEAERVLSRSVIYRDGPGFRSIRKPSYYFPLNEIRNYVDGEVRLIWEVGSGGRDDFYANVIEPFKQANIPLFIEEFTTESDKHRSVSS